MVKDSKWKIKTTIEEKKTQTRQDQNIPPKEKQNMNLKHKSLLLGKKRKGNHLKSKATQINELKHNKIGNSTNYLNKKEIFKLEKNEEEAKL
jgi:hypothetical protein